MNKWVEKTTGTSKGHLLRNDGRVGRGLSKEDEKVIERAVERTVEEYGEALKKMGNE